MSKKLCLICNIEADDEHVLIGEARRHGSYIKCPRCTQYQIDSNDTGYLKDQLKSDVDIAILSHAIHKMRRRAKIPLLSQDNIPSFLQEPLPGPSEQMNNFVLWLGHDMGVFGRKVTEYVSAIQSEIGSLNIEVAHSIIKHLKETGIIETSYMAGALETASTLISTLTPSGWELYEKLKQIADISDTGKLLKFLTELPASTYSDPEIIKNAFSWSEEQFQEAYLILKRKGFVDAQYADNKPFGIWVTEKGRIAATGNFQLLSAPIQPTNTYHQYGDIYSVNTAGQENNIAVGPGASANKGLNDFEIKRLFEEVFRQLDNQDITDSQKIEIQDAVELIQDEVSKGEKANEKALTTFFRTLQKMAPDILDVTIAAATNPLLAASVITKKVAEKIKMDATQKKQN